MESLQKFINGNTGHKVVDFTIADMEDIEVKRYCINKIIEMDEHITKKLKSITFNFEGK